jgi:hypothetical protein
MKNWPGRRGTRAEPDKEIGNLKEHPLEEVCGSAGIMKSSVGFSVVLDPVFCTTR